MRTTRATASLTTSRASSAPSDSAIPVEPTRSANSTVITLRSSRITVASGPLGVRSSMPSVYGPHPPARRRQLDPGQPINALGVAAGDVLRDRTVSALRKLRLHPGHPLRAHSSVLHQRHVVAT